MNREENLPTEMILVRHGESEANAKGIWQGQLDFPLSDLGREQALRAGDALSGDVSKISAFYASPLSRAFETAEIAARGSGYTGEIVAVAGLTERGGGLFEGSTWSEREETMPEVLKEFRSASEEEGWSRIGAETDEEILARFTPSIEEIMSLAEPGSIIVVVAHGGVMRAYLRDLFGPEVLAGEERAANASITRISWSGDGSPTLLALADTTHLSDESSSTRAGEPVSE